MRLLFVGGTGLISSACVLHAVAQGHQVWLLNRGQTLNYPVPPGVRRLVADVNDPGAVDAALGQLNFDCVVEWIGFTPQRIASDIDAYASRTSQYVFISSASAYQKPPAHYLIREDVTPLENPFWRYSQDKIACEELLLAAHRDHGFPATIVRPSLTYGPSQVPVCVGSWERPFTIIDRMRRGAPIIVPGDGTSLWVLTHHRDFAIGLVGLLGNPRAIGEAVHITSDEVLTWNEIYRQVADAAGVEPRILHVPTDALVAANPESLGSLWGDKVHSVVFDNTKIRDLVPEFRATIPFADGIRETVAWFDADSSRQAIDEAANHRWDHIATVYTEALQRVAP